MLLNKKLKRRYKINSKKSLALSYELVLAVFSLIFVAIIVFFLLTKVSNLKSLERQSTPNINDLREINLLNVFLSCPINSLLLNNIKLPEKYHNYTVREFLILGNASFLSNNNDNSVNPSRERILKRLFINSLLSNFLQEYYSGDVNYNDYKKLNKELFFYIVDTSNSNNINNNNRDNNNLIPDSFTANENNINTYFIMSFPDESLYFFTFRAGSN